MEIEVGAKILKEALVTEEKTAVQVGSGELDVFATPMMVALMEEAAAACCGQFLSDDMTSVGTCMNVTHMAATPVGMKVKAQAEITEVNGREITFSVKAQDERGPIGEGTHKRFLVKKEKFRQKTYDKLKG